MEGILKLLRQRTEAWKSFPAAVAALISEAGHRGASRISVLFYGDDLVVTSDGSPAHWHRTERLVPDALSGIAHPALAFVHHAQGMRVSTQAYRVALDLGTLTSAASSAERFEGMHEFHVKWTALGTGDGVNGKQDRTAARLVRQLPHHLTPSEAAKVTVTDTDGRQHVLTVEETVKETVDGYEFVYPATLTDVRRMDQGGELRLSYKGIVIPLREFAARLPVPLAFGLTHLHSPWLRGVIEAREPVGVRGLGDAFADEQLALALVRASISRRVVEQVQAAMRDIVYDALGQSGEFRFNGRRWQVGIFPQTMPGQNGAAWIERQFDRDDLVTPIHLDPLHALFQVDSNPSAVAERVRFVIAEVLRERFKGQFGQPVTTFYLNLRANIDKSRA